LAAGYFLHNADLPGICPYNRKYRHFRKKRKILPKAKSFLGERPKKLNGTQGELYVGSSAILALWILAASPETPAAADRPANVVTRATFPSSTFEDEVAETDQEAPAAPRRLPPDPAYDGVSSLVAQKGEGIPGCRPRPIRLP